MDLNSGDWADTVDVGAASDGESIKQNGNTAARDVGPSPGSAVELGDYSNSAGFFALLARLGITLAFTSYQGGTLSMLGSTPEQGPQLHQAALSQPMGLAYTSDGALLAACAASVVRYTQVLRDGERIDALFDACFMPRTVHVTGALDAHDIAVDRDGQIVFVNTRFNCLATLSDTHGFRELWRPRFISALVDEDRCHLNGLAMANGHPAFVTAVSRSDTVDGWRDRRHDGGVVVDVAGGEVVATGLSMPHSPRLHDGALWLLNSGSGELGRVDLERDGRFEPVTFCPGFARGLAFHGRYAFVGLSEPRHKRFEGLALDARLAAADSDPWCGIQVIDLERGSCVEWFRIDGALSELYDLVVLPSHRCAMSVSPSADDAARLITYETAAPTH